ncbi:MAG: hypothetical protein R3F33_13135 [Planctomycetota bacterium]
MGQLHGSVLALRVHPVHWSDPCNVADDSFEDNDDCATATMVADGTYAGLMLFPTDNDYFTFCVPNGATVSVDILFTDATPTWTSSCSLQRVLRTATV